MQTDLEPVESRGQIPSVQVYLQGQLATLSDERKSAAVAAFATVIGVSQRAIKVYRVYEGSIVFDLGIPTDAFQRLRTLLQANSNQLRMLKVEKVVLRREADEFEEWVNTEGQFQLVASTHLPLSGEALGGFQSFDEIERQALDEALINDLKSEVKDLFSIVRVETPDQAPHGTILFLGDLLRQDSEAVYDLIAERWRVHGYTPLLRRRRGQIALVAQPGVVIPKPSNPWINLGLAIATVISMLYNGAVLACQCPWPQTVADWLGGLPMMLGLMGILLAHEFGHYFAARIHKVAVTLPYFIPVPFFFTGTLGAFIQLRSPFKTKKQLFDIGVAGPLAGLILAIPLIFWGMASSPVQQISRGQSILEGNSIFYMAVKYLVHGQLLPSFDQYADLPFWQEFFLILAGQIPAAGGGLDVSINLLTLAAWFGLFVTAMNLLPIGQLDGGHVIYCLLGDKARWLGIALIGAMVLAGFLWPGWWLWALLVFFVIGPSHPPPLNDLVELGFPRRILSYLVIGILIIMFMPTPLQFL